MARKPKTAEKGTAQAAAITAANPQNAPLTRKSRLIALLGQEGGCTLAAISDAFGWKPHTTRAAIAGLRKAGHQIETFSGEGGTGYCMMSAAPGGSQPTPSGR